MKFHHLFPLVVIFLSSLIGIVLYPYFPDMLATHWDIVGQVNGYSSKAFALFFLPAISLIIYFLLLILPKADPYKKNFTEFDQYYFLFVNVIFAFFFYIYLLTIFWHLGSRFNMVQALSPALAILYYYAGVLTKNAHRNWFVGIRTPWTMVSDYVWQKTHELGGNLFFLSGILAILGTLFPNFAFILTIAPVLISTFTLFIYSYITYLNRPRSSSSAKPERR